MLIGMASDAARFAELDQPADVRLVPFAINQNRVELYPRSVKSSEHAA